MTSHITLLSLHWGLRDGVLVGSIGMRWVQSVGLIPLRSYKEYSKTDLYFSRMAMSLDVSSSESLLLQECFCHHLEKHSVD
jgi:hypothetical protein